MADGLFLPDGTFHPFSAAELSTELATRSNAGVLFGELEPAPLPGMTFVFLSP